MRRVLGAWLVAAAGLALAPAAASAAVSVGPASQTIGEAAGTLTFTVTRDAVGVLGSTAAVPVTVSLGRAQDTAACPADVSPCSMMVSVAGNLLLPTTADVTFSVVQDVSDEVDETLSAHVTAAPGETFDATAYAGVTITDDDAAPVVSLGAASVTEGTGAAATTLGLPVTLSAASGRTVSVGYDLTAGTATAADVALASGIVTLAPGVTTATIPAQVVADAIDEGGPETFTATLRATNPAPTNATIAAAPANAANGTILDDDTAQFSVADVATPEGAAGTTTPLTFTVALSTPASRAVTVNYATSDASAVSPGDYAATTGTVVFAAGATQQSLVVNVAGDGTVEPDETFGVTLSAPNGAPIARGSAVGTIANDDAAPVPSAAPAVPAGPGGASGAGGTSKPGGSGGPADTTAPKGKLAKFTLKRPGTLRSSITCPAYEVRCLIAVTVFTVPAPRGKVMRLRRELKVGAVILLVEGGERRVISVKIAKKTLKLLKQAKRTKVQGYAVLRDAAGNVGTTQASGVLTP